jgi:hypothetical protein
MQQRYHGQLWTESEKEREREREVRIDCVNTGPEVCQPCEAGLLNMIHLSGADLCTPAKPHPECAEPLIGIRNALNIEASEEERERRGAKSPYRVPIQGRHNRYSCKESAKGRVNAHS